MDAASRVKTRALQVDELAAALDIARPHSWCTVQEKCLSTAQGALVHRAAGLARHRCVQNQLGRAP